MHPSKKVILKDTVLTDKRIVIGITGSIAAVETVKLIRELLRHGAEIIPVMTKEAERLIHPNAVEFAAGRPPITELTGQVEHVLYCGDAETAVDLVMICPATANTISKIACGIDDTPVTTFATTAMGTGIPLLICPSMHGTMWDHRIVTENITKLRNMGINFIEPNVSEGKAKLPSRLKIVEQVIRTLATYKQDRIAEKRVLIIGGSTAQPLDAMRVLTNRSSGRTAITLANEAYRKGAEIQLWYGWSYTPVPEWIENVRRFTTVDDLLELVENSEMDYDIIILCAAISDYTLDSYQGKIGSGFEELKIDLHPTPKVIEVIREKARDAFLVGYKAESDIEEEELMIRAEERMNQVGCDLMVANLLEDVSEEDTRVFILVKEEGAGELTGSKKQVASSLFEIIGNKI